MSSIKSSRKPIEQAHTTRRNDGATLGKTACALTLACALSGLGGCADLGKNLVNYLNIRNSFLDPSQVGRFDKDTVFGGSVRPVKWPILDRLDLVDSPADPWAAATDPTPADLIPDRRESSLANGDVIRVAVFGLVQSEQEWTRDLLISPNGTITVPYLGNVEVTGLTTLQVQEKLKQIAVAKRVLPEEGNGNPGPQIAVTTIQNQGRTFSAIGQVKNPGTYAIYSPDMRLLNALSQVGDLAGGTVPGMDYLYVIRSRDNNAPTTQTGGNGSSAAPDTAPTTSKSSNPLEAIDTVVKPAPETTPAPAPQTAPSTTPNSGASGPKLIKPLPSAAVPAEVSKAINQADLDAAVTGAASAPAKTATTAPADDLMNQAIGTPTTTKPGQYVWIDGKWVLLPGTAAGAATQPATDLTPGTLAGTTPTTPAATQPAALLPPDVVSSVESANNQRVIRIPIVALRAGESRYNIVIRPGDVINIPSVESGEFYMMGHIQRPGVYEINGRKITLKQAVAAAGNLDALAIPRRCDLIRRIGDNQEAIVQVNLQAIFDGEQADIFLKPYDLINVGTDAIAPFLAVTRNAYRFSYGFGFVYDRNFFNAPAPR